MRETCKHCGSTNWRYTGKEEWTPSHMHKGVQICNVRREAKCADCGKLFNVATTCERHHSFYREQAEHYKRTLVELDETGLIVWEDDWEAVRCPTND